MVTITLAGDGSPSLENQRRLTKGIRRWTHEVRRYLKRRFRWLEVDYRYVWVKELGSLTERLHVHLLWTLPFMRQSVLSKLAARCGLGFRLDIRSTYVLNGRGGFRQGPAGYISKYLTKTTGRGLPKNSRRFQTFRVPKYQSEPGWCWRPTFLPAKVVESCGRTYWLLDDQYLPVRLFPKTTTASSRGPPTAV